MAEKEKFLETAETGEALKKSKKVRVKIPVDKMNPKTLEPVFVSINGYPYQIKRGEAVEVPEEVAFLLEQGGYI